MLEIAPDSPVQSAVIRSAPQRPLPQSARPYVVGILGYRCACRGDVCLETRETVVAQFQPAAGFGLAHAWNAAE